MSLFLRNLFFTILQPGIVAGLIPYWLLGKSIETTLGQTFTIHHYVGITTFIIGFIIMSICIISFAVEGRGTLSPADPTKKLVISGLYKYSRNPMYIGVMIMLIGECIFFQSTRIGIYSLLIFTAFNIFIIYFEEVRLRKDFGEEYVEYMRKVGRWF